VKNYERRRQNRGGVQRCTSRDKTLKKPENRLKSAKMSGKSYANTQKREVKVTQQEDPKTLPLYPRFKNAYPIAPENLERIAEDMEKNGYDISEPIKIAIIDELGGLEYVYDGHTRREASIRVGLIRVPCVRKRFKTVKDVLAAIGHIQKDRRNLDDKSRIQDIMNHWDEYMVAPNKKAYVAELLRMSERTAAKYISILSDPKRLQLVMDDRETVNSVQAVKGAERSKFDEIKRKVEKLELSELDELEKAIKRIKKELKRGGQNG